MGLLEDINSGRYNLVIIIIGFFFIFHLYWKKTNTEQMADTNIPDQIKEGIKQYYLADIESIRNLSEIANKLQAGGLTMPGNMNVQGKLNIGSNANSKDFPEWLTASVENTGDSHIRLKTKNDDNKNIYAINRDGHFRLHTHGVGDIFGVNHDGHTYNLHTGDHVHHFVGKGDNPYITLSKEGEWGGKSWYLQNVKNDGTNKVFRIGVHDDGSKLDIHKNGNAYFSGTINTPNLIVNGRNLLNEFDNFVNNLAVRYDDTIAITNRGTGNHEGNGTYLGLCGGGGCGKVSVNLHPENEKDRAKFKIIRF